MLDLKKTISAKTSGTYCFSRSLYKIMRGNNFNKLRITVFATFTRKRDFSPAKNTVQQAGLKPHFQLQLIATYG